MVAFLEQSAAAPFTDLRVCAWERGEWTLPVTLVSLPADTAARPAMSADGRTLAIAGYRGESGYAIRIIDRPGEVWAAPHELPFLVLLPWVSLDQHGQLLAFIGEASGSPQVHAVRRSGLDWGERELVSDPRLGPASHPYLAPDGRSLIFVQRNRLVLAQAVEGGWTVSEWRGTAATGGELLWPALSADGSTAFVWRITARDGKKVKELFVVPREGTSHRLRRIGGPSAFLEQDTGPAGVDAAGSTVVFSGEGTVMTSRHEANGWISSSLPASPGAVSIPALAADGATVVWAGGDPRSPAASAVLAAKLVKVPVISLPTPQLEFGSVLLDSSITRSFTIRNVGKAKLKITRLQFDGGSGGPFVLGKVKLPSSVSPNKTLTIKVTYTPRELTESSALLWITSNDKVSPVVGEILRGTGTWPAPVLTSISPTAGDEGSSATLQGSGFGTTASQVSVTVSGGYILDAAVGSVSDKSMSVTIPTGFCAWKKYQDAVVWATVRGVQSGGAYFRLTNLMPCEPAIVLTDPHAGGIGDPVTLKAYGLPAELDRILVSFNGAVTHPESIRPDWDPELAYITVRVPEGATTGPLRLKRTDGVDRWSQPADFTVMEPTPLVLTAGDEADGIVVPVVTFDIGLPSESAREYGPAPWRLGGAYLTRIRASLDHPPGTLNLEVSTPNGTATTELMAAGDTVGIVNRPPWTLFKGMKPGDTFAVRASGYELYSRVVRQSPWLTLTVGRVLYPGTATAINSAFELPVREGRLAMAQGDTLLVAGTYRDETLSAAGLWNGTVTLNQYAHPFALFSGQLFSTLVLLDQPGAFTIANQTTGQSIQVDVFAAGNNSASYADNNRGFAFGEALAREGAILGCGGARLTIPPGALPARQTDPEQISEYYYVSCAHNPEIRSFADATIGDAGHSLAIGIDRTRPNCSSRSRSRCPTRWRAVSARRTSGSTTRRHSCISS